MKNVTLWQLGELIAQAKAGRVTGRNLQTFLRNPNRFAVRGQDNVYPIVVDYGQTIEQMVEAGYYARANPVINSQNFFYVCKTGVVARVVAELVQLQKHKRTTEDAFNELRARGLCPGKLPELLAFGATYLEVPLEFRIVALDPVWTNSENKGENEECVPFLSEDVSGTSCVLDIDALARSWTSEHRFLGIRVTECVAGC